jgi:hypothetical protein
MKLESSNISITKSELEADIFELSWGKISKHFKVRFGLKSRTSSSVRIAVKLSTNRIGKRASL